MSEPLVPMYGLLLPELHTDRPKIISHPVTWRDAKRLVGGGRDLLLEAWPRWAGERFIAIVDEEGMIRGLPPNQWVYELFDVVLAGPALVVSGDGDPDSGWLIQLDRTTRWVVDPAVKAALAPRKGNTEGAPA